MDRLIRENRGKSQITQMMVGIGNEKDEEIIRAVEYLNRRFRLSRVYFSAFFPVRGTPLENRTPENPLREHRLYQVDFLIFPVEINTADYETLIRVLGIGKATAKEIIKRRGEKKISTPADLRGIL